ncbi:hypothetical protein ACIOZM_25980 [Pseudomonas sp. NPDC087346]|uniref:hypothetical protein n=1 Tax=Pseudomonas sp. NPDC087346 TaxID=3364438 RepID=UPI00381BC29F
MTTVFIAGSINIKNLDPKVKERINNIAASNFEVGGGDVSQLEELIAFMSDHAKQKANEKIKLFERISLLKHDQAELSF